MLTKIIRLRMSVGAASQGYRAFSSASTPSHVPVIRTLAQLRRWRKAAREKGLEVGVVPTMGALHQGHLDLVKASLKKHPLTVMTLFVNPMQFAPTEDLGKYPRTMERDLDLLRTLINGNQEPSSSSNPTSSSSSGSTSRPTQSSLRGLGISEFESFRPRPPSLPETVVRGLGVSESDATRPSSSNTTTSASSSNSSQNQSQSLYVPSTGESPLIVFAPTPEVMYPLKGELQDLEQHKGVTVDVKGWGNVMEGASRPQFFKGVATVCTKLFNAVEPDHAYFGQKDIQQALLLRIMLTDLLANHPAPENLHILPTTRDPKTNLALSSRNAYLSESEHRIAPILYKALSAAQSSYNESQTSESIITGEDMISAATATILEEQSRILDKSENVELQLDYIEIFDPRTFEPVRGKIEKGRELVIAGAVWVGKTRLIDNLLLGWGVQ